MKKRIDGLILICIILVGIMGSLACSDRDSYTKVLLSPGDNLENSELHKEAVKQDKKEVDIEEPKNEQEEVVVKFLKSLINKDTRLATEMLGGNVDKSYYFLEAVDINECYYEELKDSTSVESVAYKITLNSVTTGENPIPNGISYWYVELPGAYGELGAFYPLEDNKSKVTWDKLSEIGVACYGYAEAFSEVTAYTSYSADEIGTITLDERMIHRFYHSYPWNSPSEITVSEFYQFIEEIYGIKENKDLVYNFSNQYVDNKLQKIDMQNCSHGGNLVFDEMEEYVEDSKLKTISITINYYADAAFFVVAKKIKYNFSLNEEGKPHLIDVRVLEDNGYEVLKIGI